MQGVFLLRKLTRRLYSYRGLSRLAELVRKFYLRADRRLLIHDFDGDLSFYCGLNEHISSQLFWRGHYSGDQLTLLREILRPGMVFLDAGANKGEFTVFAAKYITGGKVFAFEPVEKNYNELVENVAINGFSHVRIIRKGLGDSPTFRPVFNADKDLENERNLGTFTLYPRPGMTEQTDIMEIVRLDDFVDEEKLELIDVMKIDVEGGEMGLLRGAEKTIARWRPIVFIEVNDATSKAAGYDQREILRYFEARGYRCSLIGRRGKTRNISESELGAFQNILCRPE